MKRNKTRKEKKVEIEGEVYAAFLALVLTLAKGDEAEIIRFIKVSIANPLMFEDMCAKTITDLKPHVGRRASLKFLGYCKELGNDPALVYSFCKMMEEKHNKLELNCEA